MPALCQNIRENVCSKYLTIGLCTTLTCYIMFKVVYNFVITRPTSFSHENARLYYLPEIAVCAVPAMDLSTLEKHGYEDSWTYYMGRNGTFEGNFVGWTGKENNDSVLLLEEMLNVKIKDSGLVSQVFDVENGVYVQKNAKHEFEMMGYPNFRCQVLKPRSKSLNISGIFFYMDTASIARLTNWTEETQIKILMVDFINSPFMITNSFQMKGTPILVDVKEKGYHGYRVKISQLQSVEGSPHFDCQNYSEENTYGRCIEDKFREKVVSILNCTPPWLPSNRICNKEMDLGADEAKNLDELFYYEQDLSKL